MDCLDVTVRRVQEVPLLLLVTFVAATPVGLIVLFYVTIYIFAPRPRPPKAAEKTYKHITSAGKVSIDKQLPCWTDRYIAEKEAARLSGSNDSPKIEPATVFVSVVVPAYNEQDRLGKMLTEAVEYLEEWYSPANRHKLVPPGYEIIIVSDGSTDDTVKTALDFAKTSPAPSNIRVISLVENRGKGGAVTHGLRHVRGEYVIFADADGASSFCALDSLIQACKRLESKDNTGRRRAIAIGSRAHLVGSPAVVRRSFLRNFLMHGFHLFLRFLTPPRTARIRDTQCGFKLFSRHALPDIVPYMHSEGWIFDVEMLMLAESAGIEVAEVPVEWHEVTGSKLNVIRDSLAMAWGLAVLRVAWRIGVYRNS